MFAMGKRPIIYAVAGKVLLRAELPSKINKYTANGTPQQISNLLE